MKVRYIIVWILYYCVCVNFFYALETRFSAMIILCRDYLPSNIKILYVAILWCLVLLDAPAPRGSAAAPASAIQQLHSFTIIYFALSVYCKLRKYERRVGVLSFFLSFSLSLSLSLSLSHRWAKFLREAAQRDRIVPDSKS